MSAVLQNRTCLCPLAPHLIRDARTSIRSKSGTATEKLLNVFFRAKACDGLGASAILPGAIEWRQFEGHNLFFTFLWASQPIAFP